MMEALLELPHGELFYKYGVAALLWGALLLVGLVVRWALARVWARSYGGEEEATRTAEMERAAAKTPSKRRNSATATTTASKKKPKKRRDELKNGCACVVTRVIDGDTVVVELERGGYEERIRVFGLDTPEKVRGAKVSKDAERAGSSVTRQIELGELATERAIMLLEGARVTLESGYEDRGIRREIFGRYLAYIRLPDGRDYGEVIIAEGLGECFGWKYPHPRKTEYERAASRAPRRVGRRRGWFARGA